MCYLIIDDGDKDYIKGFINVKEFLIEYVFGKMIKIVNYIYELLMILEIICISDVLIRM